MVSPCGRGCLVRWRRPSELLTRALWEGADDEVVRVLDQVTHELIREAAVDRDRVPVALVQVVAGADRVVAVPQADRHVRLALDAHLQGRAANRAQGEHLAGDLEHRMLGSEWKVLDGSGL